MSFFTPIWRQRLRNRLHDPAFDAAVRALYARTASYHSFLPPHPEQQAGYYHEFFCPEHAVQLVFNPHSPTRHVCPIDQTIFVGEPFDHAYLWSVNDVLSDAAFRFALSAFQKDETGPDALRASEILLGYARNYLSMPKGPTVRAEFSGVVTYHGLDESVWLVRIAWAFAMLDGYIPPHTAREICDQLLRPGAEHMRENSYKRIHNVTNWCNAALVTLGLVLEDESLIVEALDGEFGLYAQLHQGVLGDGLWFEGSLSYHYYSLAAIVWTVRSLEASGRSFRDWGRLRKMFEVPLRLASPDLSLPAINDCWFFISLVGEVGHGIPDAAGFYESAWAWFNDQEFGWVLDRNYLVRPRDGIEALLDGSPKISSTSGPKFESCALVSCGLGVLRSDHPTGSLTCLILKAGPSHEDHSHPDQLAIQLFAVGARIGADLGTAGYGIGLNDTWYRQTASHSTVLVDGGSQPLTTAFLDNLSVSAGFTAVSGAVVWTEGQYATVRMRRTVAARGGYYLDIFDVESGASRQFDWIFSGCGEFAEGSDADEFRVGRLTGDCGYEHFESVRVCTGQQPRRMRWKNDAVVFDLHMPAPAGEKLFTGIMPGNPAKDFQSVLVRRNHGVHHRFLSVLESFPDSTKPLVNSVSYLQADEGVSQVVVETLHAVDYWSISASRDGSVRLTLTNR